MRSLSAFVLLAGVGVGLFVYLPAPVDGDISLNQVRRHVEQRIAEKRPSSAPAQVRVRTFSPNFQLTSVARKETPARPAIIRVTNDTGGAVSGWKTSVGYAAARDNNDPASRYELVVDIQKQLKRVGCYYGRIDGSWGAGTKEAMAYFTNRVNAELPVENPDSILLTLLKSHNGKSCGACPVGQAASADGRCVAQTAAYGSQRTGAQSVAVEETLPWKANAAHTAQAPAAQPLFRPVPTSVISTEPLPGRMAIGGPKTLPPVDAANAQPDYNAYTPQPGTTAALEQNGAFGADASPPPATSAPPKRRTESRSRAFGSRQGPGTPHYNLMLSLGGVY